MRIGLTPLADLALLSQTWAGDEHWATNFAQLF